MYYVLSLVQYYLLLPRLDRWCEVAGEVEELRSRVNGHVLAEARRGYWRDSPCRKPCTLFESGGAT